MCGRGDCISAVVDSTKLKTFAQEIMNTQDEDGEIPTGTKIS